MRLRNRHLLRLNPTEFRGQRRVTLLIRCARLRFAGRLALAALVVVSCAQRVTLQTAVAARRALIVPILADGTLEPPPGGEVRAPEGGVIAGVLVHEGQRVTRNTPLLQLDNPDLAQRVLASRAESAQIGGDAAQAVADAADAGRERDRLRGIADADARLLQSGAITAQQKAADDFAYQQSVEKARQAQARAADLRNRKQILDASMRDLEARATSLVLRAPIEGVVYNLPRVPGESVAPGQLVATVADPQHVRVRARVDSPDLPRIRIGQRMIVTFDGLPNQQWQGRTVLVPPGLREAGGREVGEVIGEISGDASSLPANASVNVEIVTGEKAAALVIPRSALLRDATARFVYLYDHGKAKRTPVQVGLVAPSDAEIVSGLQEGDRVILPGTAPLHDGDSVKVAQ